MTTTRMIEPKGAESMAKNSVQFARIASPEEIAEYLTSLAVGLKLGEVSLESGERSIHLSPASEFKI